MKSKYYKGKCGVFQKHAKIDLAKQLKQLCWIYPKKSCSEISRRTCVVETTFIQVYLIAWKFTEDRLHHRYFHANFLKLLAIATVRTVISYLTYTNSNLWLNAIISRSSSLSIKFNQNNILAFGLYEIFSLSLTQWAVFSFPVTL